MTYQGPSIAASDIARVALVDTIAPGILAAIHNSHNDPFATMSTYSIHERAKCMDLFILRHCGPSELMMLVDYLHALLPPLTLGYTRWEQQATARMLENNSSIMTELTTITRLLEEHHLPQSTLSKLLRCLARAFPLFAGSYNQMYEDCKSGVGSAGPGGVFTAMTLFLDPLYKIYVSAQPKSFEIIRQEGLHFLLHAAMLFAPDPDYHIGIMRIVCNPDTGRVQIDGAPSLKHKADEIFGFAFMAARIHLMHEQFLVETPSDVLALLQKCKIVRGPRNSPASLTITAVSRELRQMSRSDRLYMCATCGRGIYGPVRQAQMLLERHKRCAACRGHIVCSEQYAPCRPAPMTHSKSAHRCQRIAWQQGHRDRCREFQNMRSAWA